MYFNIICSIIYKTLLKYQKKNRKKKLKFTSFETKNPETTRAQAK